jgi:hypothetical protein
MIYLESTYDIFGINMWYLWNQHVISLESTWIKFDFETYYRLPIGHNADTKTMKKYKMYLASLDSEEWEELRKDFGKDGEHPSNIN